MATEKHGFGRRYSPDPRDRGYLMRRRLMAAGQPLPSKKVWRIASTALNQGVTGTCVGHAWFNFLRCAPLQTAKKVPTPFEVYRKAVTLDEWQQNDDEASLPDADQGLDFGTSVRAGAEAVTSFGHLKSYLWAFTLQPALEFVLTQGPVVLGINWYTSFNQPDREGIIRISSNARPAGGHAILWRGADTKRGLALLSNSWGDDWGKSGECYVPLRDLDRLISLEQGEACTAVQQKLVAKVITPAPVTAVV
jgi:Papain family cysteine protease